MKIKIGVISDLHLFNKTINIERALSKLNKVDLLLIVGDIADRADEKQYNILLQLMNVHFQGVPVYCISGNHDNPARDDKNYRLFENKINNEYPSIVDECGAIYKHINEYIDLIGLNPLYHQKHFFFSDKGRQLDFLQEKLNTESSKYHIVMCHPPLIAHNPQRTADMAPYIVAEQDRRLQGIVDGSRHVIFLSGHTHFAPTLEFDEIRSNIYINAGSICPTTIKGTDRSIQQGNVTRLEISETEIFVIIEGIHSEKIFLKKHLKTEENGKSFVTTFPSANK